MIIVGNWKMNKDVKESNHFLDSFISKMKWYKQNNLRLFLSPAYPLVNDIKNKILEKKVHFELGLCAQNCHNKNFGSHTGEVSVKILKSVGFSAVIIGHSERRKSFNETNEILLEKILRCFENNLLPIFCVGETLAERQKGDQYKIIENQISILKPFSNKNNIVVAYEPVWAIGSGKTPTNEEINDIHLFIKKNLPNTSVLYGGSLNEKNAKDILSISNVDGGLVGGASLDYSKFTSIIKVANEIC